jgi:hypothetical protein
MDSSLSSELDTSEGGSWEVKKLLEVVSLFLSYSHFSTIMGRAWIMYKGRFSLRTLHIILRIVSSRLTLSDRSL